MLAFLAVLALLASHTAVGVVAYRRGSVVAAKVAALKAQADAEMAAIRAKAQAAANAVAAKV